MILVILVIGILMVTLGIVLYDKLDYGKDKIGKIFQIIGTVATIISTIVTIVLLVCVLNRVNIEKKIAIYEEENTKIEQQIADTVKQHQEYETGIFTEVAPKSSITLVTLYPELKSDTLVQSQINVYVENNKTIKELKSLAINASVYRWWLYFGK